MAETTPALTENILDTIRHMLGLEPTFTHFDQEILVNINMALDVLYQIGLGDAPIRIVGTETWSDLFGTRTDIEMVKTWIYLKVKLSFDPPSNSFTLEAYERQLAQLEWRINAQVDPAFQIH